MLVFAIVLALAGSTASAQEKSQLDEQLEQAEDGLAVGEERLRTLDVEIGTARERLQASEKRLAAAEPALAESEDELAATEAAYATAERQARRAQGRSAEAVARLHGVQRELAAKRQILEDRVVAAFKYGGDANYVGVLMETDDMADFLNTAKYVDSIITSDIQVVDDVTFLLQRATDERATAARLREVALTDAQRADALLAEVRRRLGEQKRIRAEVQAERTNRARLLEEVERERDAAQEHIDALAAESARIQEELAALAARQRAEAEARARAEARKRAEAAEQVHAQSQAPSVSEPAAPEARAEASPSAWSWPESCRRITSVYGMRWGRMHQGMDIACGYGNPITSARDGVVYATYCGGGYGNCVIIDHGDGYATLYAHQSRLAVRAGESVKQGQVIGYEGSSGNSTGSHVHFEVRLNGSPRNPCSFVAC